MTKQKALYKVLVSGGASAKKLAHDSGRTDEVERVAVCEVE